MVVEVHEVEPGFDILASGAEFFHGISEVGRGFDVAVGRPIEMVIVPSLHFPGLTRRFGVGLHPGEEFAVTEAFGDFLFQSFVVEPDEIEEMAIHAFAGVMVIAEFLGNGSAGFVEDAREEHVAAELASWTARWALSEIGYVCWHNAIDVVQGRGGVKCVQKNAASIRDRVFEINCAV